MKILNKSEWQVLPEVSQELIDKNKDYDKVLVQLLKNRGFGEDDDFSEILDPNFDDLVHDPFLFSQMEEIVEKIIENIKAKKKIIIYGDYDADGVTSSALLVEILGILKADVDVYIPDRVTEGYGLNIEALDILKEQGASLVITVDTGIRSKGSVDHAKELGLEVIITDHHVPPESKDDYPDCLILDPLLEGETYPFKKLAGVGVAYKLASAIISKAKIDDEMKKLLSIRLLDFVAIGTIADCVVLLGENRVLAKKGLEVLSDTKRIGIKELFRIAQIKNKDKIAAWNVGFQIAPRINAAGRMNHANSAFELLITKKDDDAVTLAYELNENNINRQNRTVQIVDEVEEQVKGDENIIIGVSKEGQNWNEGIVGLVAGRICERHYRPTLVITECEEGYKGSGRSIEGFDLIEAVEQCKEYLEKYGGHPMACGFSLQKENLDKFRSKLEELAAKKLKPENLVKKINVDAELELKQVDEELVTEIEKLEPYGEGNPQPKFLLRGLSVLDIVFMGVEGQHLKLKLKDNGKTINAVGFNQSELWQDLNVGDKIDLVAYLGINSFNGNTEVQLRIVDLRNSS